jgi:hypothetical protein
VKVKDAQRIIDKEIRKMNKEKQREALKLKETNNNEKTSISPKI